MREAVSKKRQTLGGEEIGFPNIEDLFGIFFEGGGVK